jgi:hypothetical protein
MPTAAVATAARHAGCSATAERLTAAVALAVLHWTAALPVLLCADSDVLLISRLAAIADLSNIFSEYIVGTAVAAQLSLQS